jgi:hypothetical protein
MRTVATIFRGHLDGGDGVAGVDRTLEARGAFDGHDVRHLRRAQQGRHAWHEVLAEGGGGPEYMRERPGHFRHLWRQRGRERMRIGGVRNVEHARDPGDLCRQRRDR